jgi:hypothetical protein
MASSKKAVKKAPQAKKSAKLTRTALAKVMMPHADTDSPNSVSCSGLLANRFLHQFTLRLVCITRGAQGSTMRPV